MKVYKLFKNNVYSFVLIVLAFGVFVLLNPKLLNYRFNREVKVHDYLRSQDILDMEDRIKDRITISDSDIYEATGYLYSNGADPQEYNFQHPPLVKYLFGYSIKLFNNPYAVQIIFAFGLLAGVYVLGLKVFKNPLVGFLASLLLLIDPVFREVTVYTLLDLGQVTFFIWFFIVYFYYPKRNILPGILLGLSMASKFYSPIIFMLFIIYLWKFYNKKLEWKKELNVLIFTLLAFSICYLKAFPFNIFFHQAKIVKYMLHHDAAKTWGSVTRMFFGGYFLWPLSFFATLYLLFKTKVKSLQFVFYLLPTTYFILLTFQTPFTRYFILILPFLYLGLSNLVLKLPNLKK